MNFDIRIMSNRTHGSVGCKRMSIGSVWACNCHMDNHWISSLKMGTGQSGALWLDAGDFARWEGDYGWLASKISVMRSCFCITASTAKATTLNTLSQRIYPIYCG